MPELDGLTGDPGDDARSQLRRYKRWTAGAFLVAGLNALLMILLMTWSVFSLATSADDQAPQAAALVATISLSLALFSAMGTIFARLARFQAIQLAKGI